MTSVVIVSYNRIDLVEKCLAAAVKNCPPTTEIILVDNGSTEPIPQLASRRFPRVKLLALPKNLGFGTGNNRGIEKSRGDYLLLLNTDAFLSPGAIAKLEKFFADHPQVGAVGAQLRNADGSIQPSGGYFPNLLQIFLLATFIDNLPLIRRFVPSIHVRYRPFFTKTRPLDWVTGSVFMVRREVFTQTGGFDESIFMYGEELEWCYRIKAAGWQIYLVPEVAVTHLGFSSSASQQYGIVREMESFVYFYRKHKPGWQLPILFVLLTAVCLLRIFRGLLTLRPELIRTYTLALTEVYQLLWKK